MKNPDKPILYEKKVNTIIFIFFYIFFVAGITKCFSKCVNCLFSNILMILFLIFKIIFICFIYEMLYHEFNKTSLKAVTFVYWNVIVAVFYLSVIIYNYFKKELNFLIYILFGLSYCFIGFIVNLITKDNNKNNTLIFLFLSGGEIIFLLILIKCCIHNYVFWINQSFWNIVILDILKYFVIIGFLIKILGCLFDCLLCSSNNIENNENNENKKEEPSIPTYMGANGEIIDQNGKRLW